MWVQLLFGELGKRLFDVYKVINETCTKIDQCNDRGNEVNVYFFYLKSLQERGSCSCKYRNEEGYKADDDCKEETNGNYLCNGSVTGSCNFLGGCVNNSTVEVGSGRNKDLREGEHKADNTGNNCVEGRHANSEVKHCHTSQNGKRADNAAEKHLGEQKLRCLYGEGFCLEGGFAVSGDVGRTEGVGQNTEYQNDQECQRELKAAAERVKDQGLKQRVAAVDHKRHCKRNCKIREEVFGLAVNRNEFLSQQAGGHSASKAEGKSRAALSAIAVSVKNETVERAGDQEGEQERCCGKACGNEDRLLHINAKQQRCECICGIGVKLCTHQDVHKVAGEQELDGAGFKQSAQNVENARVKEEGTNNENGQRNEGQEISCAEKLDDDHVRQDQERCQKEGYHGEQQIYDGGVDQKISSRAKNEIEDGVNGNDQHKCRNVRPEQQSRELCAEDGSVFNRQTQEDRDIRASCKRAAHFFEAHNTKCHNDDGVDRIEELVRSCNGVAYFVYLYVKIAVGNRINQNAEDACNNKREDN